jgi:integrase
MILARDIRFSATSTPSLLISSGESVKVVQERLGHASAEITMNTCAHLWPDSEDKTRAAVDAVLGKSDVSDPCQKHPVEK